jgi:2-phosphosulfolactate phosphatase
LRVRVAFTPGEEIAASVGVVIDVLRATSTICQAFAAGYGRVVCVGGLDEARALAAGRDDVALAGERLNLRPEGFDFGNSPRELVDGAPPRATLVLTTTNGTRMLLGAAARCETVLVGSLLNLDAVVAAVRESGAPDVAFLCAGVEGSFALDDAYVAGVFVGAIGGDPDDAAVAAARLAGAFATDEEGIGGGASAANIRRVGLDDDIPWCARRNLLDVLPRVVGRTGATVELEA